MVRDQRVKQRLIVVLQIPHQGIFAKRGGLVIERLLAAFALVLERTDVRRQQPMKGKSVALFLGEGGAFIEFGVKQQVVSG